jgi:hypothetical protein
LTDVNGTGKASNVRAWLETIESNASCTSLTQALQASCWEVNDIEDWQVVDRTRDVRELVADRTGDSYALRVVP